MSRKPQLSGSIRPSQLVSAERMDSAYDDLFEKLTKVSGDLAVTQARLEDAEKLLRPFANYHCNDDGCECHNCEAHRFISKPLSDNEGGE